MSHQAPAILLACVPLVGLLALAAVGDVRGGRIPNWLTLGLLAGALANALTGFALVSPIESVAGAAAGLLLPMPQFALGALGGGDVKLLAGVGAWVGPLGALLVFVLAAIVGMLIVVVQSLAQRRLTVLMRNAAVVTLNVVHLRELGIDHAADTRRSCRGVDRPLPYAVPILVAVLIVLVAGAGAR